MCFAWVELVERMAESDWMTRMPRYDWPLGAKGSERGIAWVEFRILISGSSSLN